MTTNAPTFADCFCAKHRIPREKYARAVFNRTLYWRAQPFRWLLTMMHPNYFVPDFDLIYGVENLRNLRDFVVEAERFNQHPANRGWVRRTICMRVSTGRLKRLIRETLPPRTKRSASPTASAADNATAVPFQVEKRESRRD